MLKLTVPREREFVMADPNLTSPIAPAPQYPERVTPVWERKFTDNPVRRGPLRFQEGLGTDRDIPAAFAEGVMQGYRTAPGRPNRNAKVDTKYPQETLAERAHAGSAAWVEAPTFRNEFAHGAFSDQATLRFETAIRSGQHYLRQNPAQVWD